MQKYPSFSFRCPKALAKQLKAEARTQRVSTSILLREIVTQFIEYVTERAERQAQRITFLDPLAIQEEERPTIERQPINVTQVK